MPSTTMVIPGRQVNGFTENMHGVYTRLNREGPQGCNTPAASIHGPKPIKMCVWGILNPF